MSEPTIEQMLLHLEQELSRRSAGQRAVLDEAQLTRLSELPTSDKDIDFLIEECSELIHALCRAKRGRPSNVAEELGDVLIMAALVGRLQPEGEISQSIDRKLQMMEVARKPKENQ